MPCDSITPPHNERSEKKGSRKPAGTDRHTYLRVIRAVESLGEEGRLCEGHTAETANETASDDALFATEGSNLETRVLRSLEHLVSMKTIERLCRVLARNCTVDEDRPPARMQVGKAG
jgi:hypothetical protein